MAKLSLPKSLKEVRLECRVDTDALISNRPDLAVSVRNRFMSVRQSQGASQ